MKQEVLLSLATFDTRIGGDFRVLIDSTPIKEVQPIDGEMYSPSGMTPLLDSTMKMLKLLKKSQANNPDDVLIGVLMDESGSMVPNRLAVIEGVNRFISEVADEEPDNKGGRVLCMIVTDGLENASVETTREALADAIREAEGEGWTFLYLGANQDVWGEATAMGFSGRRGQTFAYTSSPGGTQTALASSGSLASTFVSDSESYDDQAATLETTIPEYDPTEVIKKAKE